ncbi:MAG: hypothetical protein AB4041_12705 [Microcystaceae cyanobacterium]
MKTTKIVHLVTVIASTVTMLYINQKSVTAGDVTLGFDSLPTAQGWNYRSNNSSILEANVFSVDGVRLNQNTLGIGGSSSSIPESSNILGLFLVGGVMLFTGIKFKNKEDHDTEKDS